MDEELHEILYGIKEALRDIADAMKPETKDVGMIEAQVRYDEERHYLERIDRLIPHAPVEPQRWFKNSVVLAMGDPAEGWSQRWQHEYERRVQTGWPVAWARAMIDQTEPQYHYHQQGEQHVDHDPKAG